MKTLLLASLTLSAWTASEYLLLPKPEPERKIVRSFHIEAEMASEPSGDGEMGEGFDQETSRSFTLVCADTIGEVKDGAVNSVTRTFQELNSSTSQSWSGFEMEPEEMEMEMGSELEGHSVFFAVGEEPTWAEGDSGDDDLLEDLVQGMALIELLPEAVVEIGDTWALDPSFLEALESPGGDLKLTFEDDEGMMGAGDADEPEEAFAGELSATLASVDEEDGQRLATIALEIDVESTVDLTEMFQQMGEGEGQPEEGFIFPDIDSAESTVSKSGKGEAVWDLDAGRLVTLVLELDVEQIETVEMSFDLGEGPEKIEETSIMVGTENYEVNFDA